ncbi:MAG: molybdopterin molybdotransferase MoeA [Hyphomicrobiales bacterium]|nr:molybdopterin molybdotransferase MoeA [Hyphomicrobiales bacterium]
MAPDVARARMLAAASTLQGTETVPLVSALGCTLAGDVTALRTQPPFAASAMDGYAIRAADLVGLLPLRVIGEAMAGHPFGGIVGPMEAVRIFTGAPVPNGSDAILIQENAQGVGAGVITPTQVQQVGRFVRPAGLDFRTGDCLLKAGTVLDARHIGLAASMGHGVLSVRRRPRISLLATGDELVLPGTPPGSRGGAADDQGIVPDDSDTTRRAIANAAEGCDLIVTSGGASVGDHDFVQAALVANGFSIGFWKIAVRPGKPLMFGVRGSTLCLGLPGNPVSSMVCAILFLEPLLRKLLGQPNPDADRSEGALLGRALPANDLREEYMRASLRRDDACNLVATPFSSQDSSIQRLMASADALLIRPAHAPAAEAGTPCRIIRL